MFTKVQIAKLLIVGGFFLYLMNYGFTLFNFCNGQDTVISLKMEDAEEKSESKEKEDFKEKEKITQEFHENRAAMIEKRIALFPEFCFCCPSVYLEYITPPPEYS